MGGATVSRLEAVGVEQVWEVEGMNKDRIDVVAADPKTQLLVTLEVRKEA